jgi:hypothetical protein
MRKALGSIPSVSICVSGVWGAVQLHLQLPNATTVWPSGLRRWLKAPVRKGVGSNPTAVIFQRGAGCLGGVVAGQRGTLVGHMV